MNKAIAVEPGSELEQFILARAAKNFYGRSERETFDLFPFYSILVTAGVVNKNGDAFDVWETYQARHSPLDKPVNVGHNQNFICGHILDCIAVDEDLKPLPENLQQGDLPEKLHLVISAVVYKIWEDPKVQAQINTLIDKIAKGKTYVSMEALFKNFDFLLTNASTGEKKRIQRNNKTVGLTKYLRQYKGPGKIHDYDLARLLCDITFSAVGVVDNPANPDSIVSSNLDLFSNKSQASENDPVYINIDCCKNGDINMSEKNIEAEYKALAENFELLKKDNEVIHACVADYKAKLEEANKALATSQQELAMAKDKKDDADADDAKATITTLQDSVTKLEAKVAELENTKAELAKANDAMDATLTEFKKASKHSDRAEAMMGVDSSLTRETALQAVAKHDELSDASFAAMIEMIKGYASRAPKEVTAETVLETATAEKEVQYGTTVESTLSKTSTDIKNWLKNTKGNKKES